MKKLSDVKLMSENEILKALNERDTKNKKQVRVDISPFSVVYLFEKDKDTNEFIEDGGYSELVTSEGEIIYGFLDRESKIGIEVPNGVVVNYSSQYDSEYRAHNRNAYSNTNSLVEVGKNGDSIRIRENIKGELFEFCFVRSPNGDVVYCGDNKGIPMVDFGEKKYFVYTFYELAKDKDPQQFLPKGNTVMYQSDYPLIAVFYKNTQSVYYAVDFSKPYYFYTADNKKFYKEPNKESVLVESGTVVKVLVDKVKAVAYKELADLGLDRYNRETKTYDKPQIKEKKGIFSHTKGREA